MERIHILLVALLGVIPQVWCQTVQITSVNPKLTGGTNVYTEADTNHNFLLDVEIAVGSGGSGADDSAVDRWGLEVRLVDSAGAPLAGAPTVTLSKASGTLTPAQADLSIAAGSTGTMRGVSVQMDLSGLPDSGVCPASNSTYRLQVQLIAGNKTPAPPLSNNYTLVNGTGSSLDFVDSDPLSLTCEGAVVSLRDLTIAGAPLLENAIKSLTIGVTITSDPNRRAIVPDGTTDVWDLRVTLEKEKTPAIPGDYDVIETIDAGITRTDGLPAGGSLTFNNIPVAFDLRGGAATNGPDHPGDNTPTTCTEFDRLCVEVSLIPALNITFSGSSNVNTDANSPGPDASMNPKLCVPVNCKGLIVSSVAVGLAAPDEELCQGTAETQAKNQLTMTMTVSLDTDSAPLTTASLPGMTAFGDGTGLWKVNVHGSANADCRGDKVEAKTAAFTGAFNDMIAGAGNTFPTFDVTFDLTNVGCPQVKYICVQLVRNDAVANNTHFTYEFLNTAPISVNVATGTDLDTQPLSPQWGVTNIACLGVSLLPGTLTPKTDYPNLGEYTKINRVDFEATFTEDTAATAVCHVQGSNLWQLQAFLTRSSSTPDDAAWIYNIVPETYVTLDQAQRDQDITTAGETLTFGDATLRFDLSNLDCQEGPFYLCVKLAKNSLANKDFTLENDTVTLCSSPMNCVGVQLTSTTATSASTPSNNQFPLRQGISGINYLVDVALQSQDRAGSIVRNPSPAYPAAPSTTNNDLWDMDLFLSLSAQGTGTEVAKIDLDEVDNPSYVLEDVEIQAGGNAKFESVMSPFDLTDVQCHEFRYLCVRVNHGASHNQTGQKPTDNTTTILQPGNIARAPTMEPISTSLNDVAFPGANTPPGFPDNTFYMYPSPRLTSNNLDCFAVQCRGVEIESIVCNINPATPTGLALPADVAVLTGDLQQGDRGIFHLNLVIDSDDDAGGVSGDDLWKLDVFLSPDDGVTSTISKPVQYLSVGGNSTSEPTTVHWEDTDIDPRTGAVSMEVWTDVNDPFVLNYACDEIKYLCVRLGKGNSPLVGTLRNDTDFKMDPNPFVDCKLIKSCGGVIIEEVKLALNSNSRSYVTEKQVVDQTINRLQVDLSLVYQEQSATFATGDEFWDVQFFLARDDAGLTLVATEIQDSTGDFDHLDGAVVTGSDVANRTTVIYKEGTADPLDPGFDLSNKTCEDGDSSAAHLYLCVRVSKSASATVDFKLSPAISSTCIKVNCRGVVFVNGENGARAITLSVTGGPILEATRTNEVDVFVEFPIENNAARINGPHKSDLWRLVVFLTQYSSGTGDRITEVVAPLDEAEKRRGVSFQAPLSFTLQNKVVLDMYDELCPGGNLYVCAKLEELPNPNPDCSIDTSKAIKCQQMQCKGVEFTSIDFTLPSDNCLVEHKSLNTITFDFEADTQANTASLSGSNLWAMTVYASLDPSGNGRIRFGETRGIFDESASLTSGDQFELDDVTANLDLSGFICPTDPLYLCVELVRNSLAEPKYTLSTNPDPFRLCKAIQCKGVKLTGFTFRNSAPSALVERSGDTTIVSDLSVTTDLNYAGIQGQNLWTITGKLFNSSRHEILSQEATLTQEQRNEGLAPGQTKIFDDISVTFDLDRNVPCPADGRLEFCLVIAKGPYSQGLSPDFSLDPTSVTTTSPCRSLTCRGVCIEESTADAIGGEPLQEGIVAHDVLLDAVFTSDVDFAGIDEDANALGLWKVNVFASPDGTTRYAETDGVLDTNNENYPLPSGGQLTLGNIGAKLNFTGAISNQYLTCNDIKYVCVELQRGDNPNPPFSLFGCPSSKLVACAHFDCQGVLLERVRLDLHPNVDELKENTQNFAVNFDLVLTPNPQTSVLPDTGSNHWEVEIFGSDSDASVNPSAGKHAVAVATIPLSELVKGVTRPGTGVTNPDTTLAGLSATLDLSGTYCGDLQYLCARVSRGSGSVPAYTLNGYSNLRIDDSKLIGCTKVNCDGIAITNATFRSLEPDTIAEGKGISTFEYDINFETNPTGGGVFGTNLWKLNTFLAATASGLAVLDLNEDNVGDTIYPVLSGGAQSQTLQPGRPLGFQNVEVTFDTSKFACPNEEVFFCVRLEKDERATSEFTLNSSLSTRQKCHPIACNGLKFVNVDFMSDKSIITEREDDQSFVLDIAGETARDGGSVSGTELWEVHVFFNSYANGTGNDFSSVVEANLVPDNANKDVNAGDILRLNNVGVDVSAANLLCTNDTVYLCIRISRDSSSDPKFSLDSTSVTTRCKPVTCNPVIITNAVCDVNAPMYLLENIVNNVNFEIRLTSASLSASINGDELWSVKEVYTNDMSTGLGVRKAEYVSEVLTQADRNRDLEKGETLTLSDVRAFIDLTNKTCDDIEYICLNFAKNPAARPDFTLTFNGAVEPPWCKEIECRGVVATNTTLNIKTPSVRERRSDNSVLFDVTLSTDPLGSDVSGDNLWTVKAGFKDANDKLIALSRGVDYSLTAGKNLTFPNLLAANVVIPNNTCPEGGLYFCVYISKNAGSSRDFTLTGNTPDALHDCKPIPCEGVQFTDTKLEITNGRTISETAPLQNHNINFKFNATSGINSAQVAGDSLWKINVFASRKHDGSGPRFLERDLTLSEDQRNQDLANTGQVLKFNTLAQQYDLRGVRCIDFQYFCAEIERDAASASVSFSVQGIDGNGNLNDSVLIGCHKMHCVGVFLNTFDATSDKNPVVLLENTDNQRFTFNASIESDSNQESISGANLWAMKSFFNPSPDCQGIDANSHQIRISETDATIPGNQVHLALPNGGRINFRNIEVQLNYGDTCESFAPQTYLCLEIYRSTQANPAFTLLGNTTTSLPAECRGVQVVDTKIQSASWVPSVFIERSGGGRKRQANSITFDLSILVETNSDAAGIVGSDLWDVYVYLSGDENCLTVNNNTLVKAPLSNAEEDLDVTPGRLLTFNLDDVVVPADRVLCENARFVCAKLAKGQNPSDDFTLTGIPDNSSLVGSYPLDCRGVQITNSELQIRSGLPLITGSPNHQLIFDFQINTNASAAGVTGYDLFSLYVFGNDQSDGFGKIPGYSRAGTLLPITQEVEVIPGIPNAFSYLSARLNLQGVSCNEIPFVCASIYKGVLPRPLYTLQPDNKADPVFTDCVQVPCTGVVIEDLAVDFQSGLPLLEDAAAHRLDFLISPTASSLGGDAIGDDLWAAEIFISRNSDGRGDKYSLSNVTIVNDDVDLRRGQKIDILANAVLDLSGVVCVNVQYICVDLYKGANANPDFTLGGVQRVCQGFTCKGVDFINAGLRVHSNIFLRMLTPNTHVAFDAYVSATPSSSSVSGYNLFKIHVFASESADGSGARLGENYANLTGAGKVDIVAGQRSELNNVAAYLNLTRYRCSELKHLCIEIWRGAYANPYYQIDSPASTAQLRVCQAVACYGVQIAKVEPEVQVGKPLIENSNDRQTWIDIHVTPSPNSASIIGDNLWKASCFANSRPDGSGTRYSYQDAILQPSEVNKDFIHSYTAGGVYIILQNAAVSMDYSGRHCSEIQYICCTVGENDNANPDFDLQGAYGNNNLLTGCSLVDCLGVGVTATRLSLDSVEILKGDDSHTFSGSVDVSFWSQSRAIQEDSTWAMSAFVVDNNGIRVSQGPVELIQEQQDRGVIPGSDTKFENLRFEMDLSNLECYQIAYVCVEIGTQAGVSFTLAGVTDAGVINDDALIGCSPHLQCSDFSVDIEVTDVGERHIEIRWNEGEGDFDTYVITYAPEGQLVDSPQNIPRELRAPLRFDGLTPGQEYIFNLYLYKGGTLKAGPVIETERTRPDSVDVTINRQTTSELHVQWTEAQGVYDLYIVELYPQGTPPTPIYVDATAPRELIFSGLREAREYTVTIYTVVGPRTGYRSLPGYASETTEPAPPFLELADPDTGTTYVDLKWIAPNGYLVAGYHLTVEPDDEGNELPLELSSDIQSFRVNGLQPGRQHEFQLKAFALVNGDKVYSRESTVSARTHPAQVPSAEIEVATTGAITIEWDEPAGDVDSYRVSYPEQVGGPQAISSLLPRRFTASGLNIATFYEFRIVTVSGRLESEPFTFAAATRPNRPGQVKTQEVEKNLIEIVWNPAQGPVDGYEVRYTPTHPNYAPASPFITSDLVFKVTGLHPYTTVDFEVRTISRGAYSDPAEWRQRTYPDLPGPVVDFSVEPSSANSALLRFSMPEYPNGLITAYIIRYEGVKPGVLGVDSGLQTITALPNEHDFQHNLEGLRSGYTYKFEIRATNSIGSGMSVEVSGITLVPGLPILVDDPEALRNYFLGISASAYTIKNVPIDRRIFSDANGDIIGFTVLVVESKASNFTGPTFPPSYNQIKNFNVWPIYQAWQVFTLDELLNGFRNKRQTNLDFAFFEVGAEDGCSEKPDDYYCNGALRPLTTYRVAVRAYTEAGYVDTPWSHRITTKADQWWFAYAAIPFLLVVMVLAIILALCACSAGEKKVDRRRKYQKECLEDDFNEYGSAPYNENVNMNASGSTIYMIPNAAEPPITGPGTMQGKLNPTHVLGTRPTQISKFKQHVETMAANNAIKFVEEYENLRPIGDDLARLIGGLPENKDKNRFSNILPYDYNRVQLMDDKYLNASFIGGFNSRHEYIATQGPLSNTVEDFWQMVWENNCPTIVMMGRCVEDGHVKCEQYWPEGDDTVTSGDLNITMVTQKVGEDWTVRDFTIQSGSEVRAVRQFNLTSWPNHGVPEQSSGVIRLVSTIRAEAPQHSGPMVIHCGAGIGRTGIFLALDILMQGLVYDETTVDVYGTVSSLRKQRCCMVQTVHQYIFLHKAMLDILQGKATGYNWLLRTRKGSVGSRDSDQLTSDTL